MLAFCLVRIFTKRLKKIGPTNVIKGIKEKKFRALPKVSESLMGDHDRPSIINQ
jgi:hypothetical protein